MKNSKSLQCSKTEDCMIVWLFNDKKTDDQEFFLLHLLNYGIYAQFVNALQSNTKLQVNKNSHQSLINLDLTVDINLLASFERI